MEPGPNSRSSRSEHFVSFRLGEDAQGCGEQHSKYHDQHDLQYTVLLNQKQYRRGRHQENNRDNSEYQARKDVDAVLGIKLYVFIFGFLTLFRR